MRLNLSIFNPASDKYHCIRQFREKLSGGQRVAAVVAAIFGSIVPVLGSTAAFRKVVRHFQPEIPEAWKHEKFINFPSDRTAAGLIFDKELFIRALIRQGINPENCKFKRIWTAQYGPGHNNVFFNSFERKVYNEEDEKLFNDIPEEENLLLTVAFDVDVEKALQIFKDSRYRQVLTPDQLCGRAPLPESFVKFMTK